MDENNLPPPVAYDPYKRLAEKCEDLKCIYLKDEFEGQITSDFRLRRVTRGKGDRYYFSIDEEGQVISTHLSVTSFTSKVLIAADSEGLTRWKMKAGEEEAARIGEESAQYGTFMHIEIARIAQDGEYDFDLLGENLVSYMSENNSNPALYTTWYDRAARDIAAWLQFVVDYQVEVIAVEFPIASNKLGLATFIDVVCRMTVKEKGFFGEKYTSGEKKGQDKATYQEVRRVGLMDLKSGKDFHKDHELQLLACRDIWNEHYEGILPIDLIFNWSPKDWEGKIPTYNLKDQTYSPEARVMPEYYSLARKKGFLETTKKVRRISGVCKMGNSPEANVEYLTYAELATQR